jgi:hypothetical protein
MFTNESNEIINELTQKINCNSRELRELFNYLDNHNFNYDKIVITTKKKKYPKLKFLSEKLYKKTNNYTNVINIQWSVRTQFLIHCELNLYSKTKISDATINLLIYSISFIMSFSDRNKNLNINIGFLNDKKKFNNKFTPNEINSGVCRSTNTDGTIHIWRLEECIKVIIHECIHFLKFSDIKDTPELIEHYNTKYNYESDKLTINEAYTEVWARLFNCYLASRLANIHDETIDKYKFFSYLVDIEKKFSIIQSLKIINFLNDKIKKGKKIDINKDTNVISYYVITAEIINNLKQFINFCKKNKNYFFLENDFNNFVTNLNSIKFMNNNHGFNNTFRMAATEIKIK